MYQQKLCLGLMESSGLADIEQIQLLRETGFEGFFSGWNRGMDLRTLRRAADQTGMMYQSVHAPFGRVDALWYADDRTQDAIAELVQCVQATAEAEAPIMVCHAFIGFDRNSPTVQGPGNFEPIIREAERLGVQVAFENTEGDAYLAALMQHFAGSRAVGFCWDAGHEKCYNDPQDMLALYGDRLLCTHLNDNLGIRDFAGKITWHDDLHLLPFDGIHDWSDVARRLNDCRFDGPLTFELTRASKPNRHDNDAYARMDIREYFALAYQRACRVAALKRADLLKRSTK